MKFTLFWSYYQDYIQSFYRCHPELDQTSYQHQKDALLADYFGWLPALAKKLEDRGVEVQILIVNAKPLQETWAKENGVKFTRNWQYEMPYEQVKRFQPDILLIGSMFHYFGDYLLSLKKHCQRIFAWIACPQPKSLQLVGIDCVLTSHSNFLDQFHHQGQASEILLPTFEPHILSQLNKVQPKYSCSFIGNLSWAHIQRIRVIQKLTKNTPLKIWGDMPRFFSKGLLNKEFIPAYYSARSFAYRVQPSVWGLKMYQILAQSMMTVNVHGDVARGLAGNMRMFEATGTGVMLLTEDAPNIQRIFRPNKEIVTYKDINQLIDRINYYIKHPLECSEIARAGQKKTLSTHSTIQRADELLNICHKYLHEAT